MEPDTIKYIIFKLFPLILLAFSIIVLLYLRKWINVWHLTNLQSTNILRTYKILMLSFTMPMLAANIIQMIASSTMQTQIFTSSYPTWLKLSYIYPYYIWHLSIITTSIALASISIIKITIMPASFIYKKTKQIIKKETLSEQSKNKRHYIKKLAITIPSTIFAVNTVGLLKSEYSYIIETIKIKDDTLKGITITQISDVHFGSFMNEDKFMFFINEINKLKSDFILITGDLLDIDINLMPKMIKCLEKLNCKGGVYACLGNHEYYAKVDKIMQNDLNKIGIKLLINETVDIKYKGTDFTLIGVDYPLTDEKPNVMANLDVMKSYLNDTMQTIKDQNKTKILMAHHPNTFIHSKEHNIKLTLSGHTHGGQINFGKWENHFITPLQLAYPYLKGHYIENDKHLYVNSGLGHWLPLRINCPVEITQIIFT